MSRSTIAIVAIFAALLVAWLLTQGEDAVQEIPPLVVQGYLKGDISLQDIKVLNKDEESPYTRFELERDGERFTLALKPGQASAKPAERKWLATRTKGGKTIEAAGESYRVKMINQLLARPFRSSYAFVAKPEDLAEYGLDSSQAVQLVAEAPERKVALIIGKSEKSEDESAMSTWVQDPARKDVVYQVTGHDLRTEAAVGWKDVRDRKILSINLAAIDKVELVNPRAPAGRGQLVASRPALTDEQRKQLDEGKKWEEVRKSDDGWKIDSPTGFAAGDIGSWLESTERMSMTETFELVDDKPPADAGLNDDKRTVTIVLHEGTRKTVVRLGDRTPKGDQQDIYVGVEGDSLAYSVASWSSDQIIKDVDTLRDLRLLGAGKAADAIAIRIDSASAPVFQARKESAGWTSTDIELDPKGVEDWLRDLDSTRVEFRTGKDLASLGLDKPATRIALTFADGVLTLSVSPRMGDKTYGRVGEGDPFELQSWNADRLHRTGRDFIDKHLLRLPVAEVVSLTVPDGDKTRNLVKDGAAWKVEGDTALTVDAAKVTSLLESLAQYSYHMEVDADRKSVGLDPAPWQLSLKVGAKTWSLALSETKKDNNPYAELKDGTGATRVVTISAMMVEQFKKSFADLK